MAAAWGIVHIEDLQSLMQLICRFGFEHHVALAHGTVSEAIVEAFENYLGWEVYFPTES